MMPIFQLIAENDEELYNEHYGRYNAAIETARKYNCLETQERIQLIKSQLKYLFHLSCTFKKTNSKNHKEEP